MGFKSWMYSALCAAGLAFGGCYSDFPKDSLETVLNETKIIKTEKEHKKIRLKDKEEKKLKTKNKKNKKQKVWKKFDIKLPPLNFNKKLPLAAPVFDHSVFGLSSDSGYLIRKDVDWNFGSNFYYHNFRFNIDDNLEDTLKEFAQIESDYPTPLDEFAEAAFKIERIRNLKVGGFTVSELYNLCRLFGRNARIENLRSGVKVALDFKVEMHSKEEAYTSHYFRNPDGTLLRYRHGTGINIGGEVGVDAFYTIKKGKGMNISLRGLERLIDSELYFKLNHSSVDYFYIGESFEQAEQTKRGWRGMGIAHRRFDYSLRKGNYGLIIDADIERQLVKASRLFSGSTYEYQFHSKNDGVFDLFYLFKEEDFEKIWYFTFAGLNRHDYHNRLRYGMAFGEYYTSLNLKFSEKYYGEGNNFGEPKEGFQIEHGGLLGLDLNYLQPFFRWTTFPEKEIFSGFYVNTPLIGRAVFSSDRQEIELLFPVRNKKDRERFVKSYRKIENTLANPFQERSIRIANIKRKGLSDADGHFIRFKADEQQYLIGFVHAFKGPYFVEYGSMMHKEYPSFGMHVTAGIKNIGIEAKYSGFSGFDSVGHSIDFNLHSELDKYFFGFYIKGLFIGNTTTPLDEYRNPDDFRATVSFGGVLE